MDFKDFIFQENKYIKAIRSENYNFDFDKTTGFFRRWGKTKNDDPEYAFAPEILDLECTTICNGVPNNKGVTAPCFFCYKSNTKNGKNMSFDTFKKIFDKFDKRFLTQIAFGVDAQATSNPDLWDMMDYSRSQGIIPNLTIADISDKVADEISFLAGACAISRYENKDICYNSVKKLTDRGMTQCNIHAMISEQTFEQVKETLQDRLTDPRLTKLNAIVLLSLKQKGRGVGFTPLSSDKFKQLVDFALDNKIGIGFDSCGANKFIKAIEDRPEGKDLLKYVEPCESSCFSSYVSVDAEFFPCSFAENTPEWEKGLDILSCNNFIDDIWNHEKTLQFRKNLLNCKRNCPLFKV